MRSGVTAREKERAERATLVQQEKLAKAKVLPALSCQRAAAELHPHCRCVPAQHAPNVFHARRRPWLAEHHASLPCSHLSASSRCRDESAADALAPAWQGRVYALNDVWIRPPFGGKGRKMTGQLEAHANGFRYSSPKGEQLDIMYRCAHPALLQSLPPIT